MTHRTYNFQFPYYASGIECFFIHHGLNDPKYKDDVAKLKPSLRAKLATCTTSTPFDEGDFNSLPDALWAKLADHFG